MNKEGLYPPFRTTAAALFFISLIAGCTEAGNGHVIGQLESERIELSAEFAEPITARHVREGETVTAGQLLIEQDAQRIEARIEEIEALIGQAEARLAELLRGPREERIRAAQAAASGAEQEVSFRRLELNRASKLLTQGLGSQELMDQAQVALDAAQAELRASRARLEELMSGTTAEELDQARQAVNQGRAQLARLLVDRARHRIVAPADGIVDSLLFEAGERPAPGQPVAILLAGKQPYARVYVPEPVRTQIAPGTRALVHVDGITDAFSGTVRWVSSEAAFTPYFALTERDRGRLSYVAKIDLEVNGDRLPDGVPVEVEFPPQ